jgi:hypothetical protein
VKNDENALPPAEMLAAYVDGELEPRERLTVERWLADHPEGRADADGQRRVARAWDVTRPREPDEDSWSAALAVIQDRIQAERLLLPRRRLPWRWLVGLAAAIAAAVVLILANRTPGPGPTRPYDSTNGEAAFQVASADDVEITSFADADSDDVLLVGHPPVREPMLLLAHDEIRLEEMTPEPGMNPRFDGEQGAPPMIVPGAEEKTP